MKTMNASRILGVALCLVASGASATPCPGPDGGFYSCTINPPGAAFIPVTSGNLVVCDDCSTNRPIGFSYRHYGVAATDIQLSSNGFIAMGFSNDNFMGNCAFPHGGDPDVIGRYRDYHPGNGGFVRDGVSGAAPNRIYAVEFNNVPPFGGGAVTTFQIQLHENGGAGQMGRILVQVLGVNNGDVGQQDGGSSNGLEYNPCNQAGLAVPWGIEFKATPPPSGGSCDLTAIEAKLDDETKFTDDAELADVQLVIESLGSQAAVDALEAKADAMQLAADQLQNTLCDVIRLLHTPNGLRRATCNGVDYEWNGLQGGGGD